MGFLLFGILIKVGLDIIDWASISIAMIFQIFLFSIGMNFNKKLIKFSATSVYLGMIIFFFVVLLSDVKLTTIAFLDTLDLRNFIDRNNFIPLITVTGTGFTKANVHYCTFG